MMVMTDTERKTMTDQIVGKCYHIAHCEDCPLYDEHMTAPCFGTHVSDETLEEHWRVLCGGEEK